MMLLFLLLLARTLCCFLLLVFIIIILCIIIVIMHRSMINITMIRYMTSFHFISVFLLILNLHQLLLSSCSSLFFCFLVFFFCQ